MLSREGILAAIAAELNETPEEVGRVWDALVADVNSEAWAGRKVVWPFFGRFEVIDLKPKRYKSPKTGYMKTSGARKKLRFYPSRHLRKKVWK